MFSIIKRTYIIFHNLYYEHTVKRELNDRNGDIFRSFSKAIYRLGLKKFFSIQFSVQLTTPLLIVYYETFLVHSLKMALQKGETCRCCDCLITF